MVTGADGFIGSHLTEELVKRGEKVRAFCLYNSFGSLGWIDTLPPEIRSEIDIFMGDVRDPNGVRTAMLIHQRRAAEDRDIVAEGRDIGTVVFPNAQVKVFLTADPRERARRRVLQRHQNDAQPLTSEQLEAEVDETLDALKQRDKLDSSREVAPLVPAEDAVHVDSTAHTIDEVVSIIEDLINQRR